MESMAGLLIGIFFAFYSIAVSASSFSENATLYQMRFDTTIEMPSKLSPHEMFEQIARHHSFLMGAMAYHERAENQFATGGPLRKKNDLTIVQIVPVLSDRIRVQYHYEGEVVLDVPGLNRYEVDLPARMEDLSRLEPQDLGLCSVFAKRGSIPSVEVLSYYWNPSSSRRLSCPVETQKVVASLKTLPSAPEFPQYESLIDANGVITISAFFGKISTHRKGNPFRASDDPSDSAASEYRSVVKALGRLGFVRIEQVLNEGDRTPFRERYELKTSRATLQLDTVYGDSIYQEPGMSEFNARWVQAIRDRSLVFYSGHSGFWVDASGLQFYRDMPTSPDPSKYQVVMINGCQSHYYYYPFSSLKRPGALDMIVNLRSTVANPQATVELVRALVEWANDGTRSSWSDLVERMNSVNALLGVITSKSP